MRFARPMPRFRTLLSRLCLGMTLLATSGSVSAETVEIVASADNTLIESATGARSNGAGSGFFVGRTSQASDSIRRGLVRFDVAGAVPPGMIITRAELRLVETPSNPQPSEIALHRVLAAWGEGESSGGGGSGAAAAPGDATWIHTFYDREFWSEPGGDFVAAASASLEVGDAGVVLFESTPETVADAQAWLDDPDAAHGWLLRGGEDASTTSKRFASREADDPAEWPLLRIEYAAPCDTVALDGAARALCRAYCETLDCDAGGGPASSRACEPISRQFARHAYVALPCERDAHD